MCRVPAPCLSVRRRMHMHAHTVVHTRTVAQARGSMPIPMQVTLPQHRKQVDAVVNLSQADKAGGWGGGGIGTRL